MTLALVGIDVALPRHFISQEDACALTRDISCLTDEQRRIMSAVYRHSGVIRRGSVVLQGDVGPLQERESFFPERTDAADRGPGTAARMQLYEQEAGPLAIRAARGALSQAGCLPREVTHLVTASCSGFAAPGVDAELVETLKLRRDISRTHVGFMGCHAGFNALRIADAFIAADPAAVVLIAAVELCSLHHYYGWDPEKVVANSLFADGAGAAVCRHTDYARDGELTVLRLASTLLPDTRDAMRWAIGDHGFEMNLSPKVPQIIEQELAGYLQQILAAEELTTNEIGGWAIHPGGPRILDACRKALGLREEQLATSRAVLAEHGNMSSATLFFLLNRSQPRGAARPLVALGFGPGLTIEAMLLD